ncbi:beta strand repeat-containing protein [Brevundimonas lenta]|uniref:Ca2+-binding RTX toxin-like protein n=1 Tax=Brevundimonas lenta TaxID=424796 RepID=A0A7W6NNN9_9CAUL|nr:pre-peptidase C-terminal domain-containing protein [Brevundimonas lenta]MBB4081365.1 Ca2+-binding RTX toxin-like protein [Brevundimonas lenta]
MPISHIYTGQPMTGTAEDDFVIAYPGSTGTSVNTVNAGDGDDWVMGDSTDTWIPNASYLNGSIATAFNLETITSTWSVLENPTIGVDSTPHTTAIVETTIGQSEYFAVAIGAGQTITIDLDFGVGSLIGAPVDLVAELLDAGGNIVGASDDEAPTSGGLGSFPRTAGSQLSYDSYLTFTAPAAGTYYINVRPFGSGPGSTFTANNTFVLNVSVTGHAIGSAPAMGIDTLNGEGGADALFGQAGADILNGGAGDDLIHGGTGIDVIRGGADNDTLYGGEGTEEEVHGDGGNDILHSGGEGHYYGDAGDDLIHAGLTSGVNEILDGGTGIDTINTALWNGTYEINLVTGSTNFGEIFSNFENVVTGNGADTITGTDGANRITTAGGIDIINAGGGDDVIDGGAGADSIDGGAGIDTADYSGGGSVTARLDTGIANDGDTLTGIENLIGSVANDLLIGDAGANLLQGGAGVDTLLGQGGNDILWGGIVSPNTLQGGTGDDRYVLEVVDTVVELAGEGTDTVEARIAAYTLSANVERLVFTGVGDFSGTGNALNNVITGAGGGDTLRGGLGSDTLLGQGGNDILWGGTGLANTLQGGLGDDRYILEAADSVVEVAGQGTDTVDARIAAYVLGANIENLLFGGAGGFTGTGNALNNTLTGGGGDDLLRGRGGVDTLVGGAGFDTADYSQATAGVSARLDLGKATNDGEGATDNLFGFEALAGSLHNDVLIGNGASNTLSGSLGADTLLGFGGDDVLRGGQGAANQVQGGAGNDYYVLDAYDTVVELAGEGHDVIEAHVGTHTMGANVEDMFYVGANKFYGTGNALGNTITGGAANDILKGMGGADRLFGGGGTDEVHLRGVAANYVIVSEGAGYRIVDSVAGRDGSTYVESVELLRFIAGNTTRVLTYPPPPSGPLETSDKFIDDAFVLPPAADDTAVQALPETSVLDALAARPHAGFGHALPWIGDWSGLPLNDHGFIPGAHMDHWLL